MPCKKEEHLNNIPLTDPFFNQSGAFDLLLASDIFFNSLKFCHINLEEVPSKRILTKEEKFCEDQFLVTTSRYDKGRFIVELPFKKDTPYLGASRTAAIKHLKQME
ncbi:unnamed protein product, partial [Allacma fusca]